MYRNFPCLFFKGVLDVFCILLFIALKYLHLKYCKNIFFPSVIIMKLIILDEEGSHSYIQIRF